MRKYVALLAATVAVGAVMAVTASAAAGNGNYSPPLCGGKQIVNVTYQLTNDADSGFHGDWAIDTLNRSLKVFDVGGGSYCATINDTGWFVTTGPNSPQNGDPLSPGIDGVINGGYVTSVFTGTLNSSPDYKTNGNLGSFNANDAHPSFLSYFNTTGSWTQPSWGWTYHTPKNGDWTNASTGSFGDIVD